MLEAGGGTVVHELLLRRPADVIRQEIETALRLGGALDVLSSRMDTRRGDLTVRAMELVTSVMTPSGEADAPGRALVEVAYAGAGMLLDVGEQPASRSPSGCCVRASHLGSSQARHVAAGCDGRLGAVAGSVRRATAEHRCCRSTLRRAVVRHRGGTPTSVRDVLEALANVSA